MISHPGRGGNVRKVADAPLAADPATSRSGICAFSHISEGGGGELEATMDGMERGRSGLDDVMDEWEGRRGRWRR
jgi:hypothetical protein